MACAKFLIFAAAFLASPFVVCAQQWPFELWHHGKVVLETGDTLKGIIKYDLSEDRVQCAAEDKKPEIYTPRKAVFFEIFDETERRYRRFFSLPYSGSQGYKVPVFFELLEEGRITVLCRERLELKSRQGYGTIARIVLVHKYFFLQEDGKIEAFDGNRSDLLDLMGPNAKKVASYIKKNNLDYEDKYDMAQIIGYYNSLFDGGL